MEEKQQDAPCGSLYGSLFKFTQASAGEWGDSQHISNLRITALSVCDAVLHESEDERQLREELSFSQSLQTEMANKMNPAEQREKIAQRQSEEAMPRAEEVERHSQLQQSEMRLKLPQVETESERDQLSKNKILPITKGVETLALPTPKRRKHRKRSSQTSQGNETKPPSPQRHQAKQDEPNAARLEEQKNKGQQEKEGQQVQQKQQVHNADISISTVEDKLQVTRADSGGIGFKVIAAVGILVLGTGILALLYWLSSRRNAHQEPNHSEVAIAMGAAQGGAVRESFAVMRNALGFSHGPIDQFSTEISEVKGEEVLPKLEVQKAKPKVERLVKTKKTHPKARLALSLSQLDQRLKKINAAAGMSEEEKNSARQQAYLDAGATFEGVETSLPSAVKYG